MNPDGQIDAQVAVNRLATRCGLLQLELDLAHEQIAALRQQLADAHDTKAETEVAQ
ncbi:MAG TPA: hypothetical protein VFM01_04670 [Nakamurella sp.]|nr:hypothetical protein [Nakamurella sp.]